MNKIAIALAITGSILIGAGVVMLRAPAEAGDVAAVQQMLQVSPTPAAQENPDPDPSESVQSNAGTDDVSEAESTVPQFTISTGVLPQAQEVVPTRLRIGADVDAPIVVAGVESNGEMQVPDNVTDVAWYGYGPAPGEAGSAVLAAHVDLAGQGPGVFFGLKELPLGSIAEIVFSDGTIERFRTFARARYDKDELPTELLFSRTGEPVLTLITCGGGFHPSLRRYDSNVVVYAAPIEATTPAPVW
jgi:hypothetical protein